LLLARAPGRPAGTWLGPLLTEEEPSHAVRPPRRPCARPRPRRTPSPPRRRPAATHLPPPRPRPDPEARCRRLPHPPKRRSAPASDGAGRPALRPRGTGPHALLRGSPSPATHRAAPDRGRPRGRPGQVAGA